jgi:glycosyltransferase involved in cell wall biosynthesis
LTNKKIEVISYWLNDSLWKPLNKKESLEKLNLSEGKYYIGSFQRDTEGSDLKTPKLEKGPDLFCDYVIKHKRDNTHVLLGGWRRQYVESRLNKAKIPYTLFEKTSLETIKLLYNCLDLYVVSSRYEGGPQAIIEAAAMKIPIISTNVGIANNILSKNCIVDLSCQSYIPNQDDISHAYKNVNKLKIKEHGKKFIELFRNV